MDSYIRRSERKGADRSARDRQSNKKKLDKVIKENIADIIAQEPIIGKSGDRIIVVPVRGIKEYRFIYGTDRPMVGEGDESTEEGDVFGVEPYFETDSGEPGNTPGADVYETEIMLEDILNMMFEDLRLPDLERKKIFSQLSEKIYKRRGTRRRGPRQRLDVKKSVTEKIKRRKRTELAKNEQDITDKIEDDWFPFHKDDLRYKYIDEDERRYSNAVIFAIMDTSGSMDVTKKYFARSFNFLLYNFIKTKYSYVDMVFITHDTEAKEVTEEEFFHKGESGGTCISSGYKKALEIIADRYSPSMWNIYAFHCSDGDNFSNDNSEAVRHAQELADIANLFGYCEIKPVGGYSWSSMFDIYKEIKNDNFVPLRISQKNDIWPIFCNFLKKERANE